VLLLVDQAVRHGRWSVSRVKEAAAFPGGLAFLPRDLDLPAQAAQLVALLGRQARTLA